MLTGITATGIFHKCNRLNAPRHLSHPCAAANSYTLKYPAGKFAQDITANLTELHRPQAAYLVLPTAEVYHLSQAVKSFGQHVSRGHQS